MSKIEWTEATWNPTVGCTRVSAGCDNCYAVKHTQRLAGTLPVYQGLVNPGKRHFNGTVRCRPDRLKTPLHWKKPRRVFVNSMSDLFHPDVPDEFIDRVFAVMALTPQHTYQILTKRPERLAEWVRSARSRDLVLQHWKNGGAEQNTWPLRNVWLGTSVEDQVAADERIPHLLRTPAAVRFLSCEPLLGPINLRRYKLTPSIHADALGGGGAIPGIDWVIVGGESGAGARPCNIDWIRSIVGQCREASVAAFVKQLGSRPCAADYQPVRYIRDGRPDRNGGDPSEWPEDLRVRQFPDSEVAA